VAAGAEGFGGVCGSAYAEGSWLNISNAEATPLVTKILKPARR
jgi:hypothetical protein